ncbi:MAG: patatin-like phospholipase family protein [Thermoflavifilum aggregans]|nr:patatin-like phospholipase family protein [Thermoflavifilum aggregans]
MDISTDHTPVASVVREYAFVLSGGGARGYAHIGVLQAFAEQGILPRAISGTSAGAIAGVLICDGYTPLEAAEIFRNYKLTPRFRLTRHSLGLSLHFLEAFLQRHLRHTYFEELRIPLFVSATDFTNGQLRVFDKGPIIPAVLAASAIPIIFPPVYIDGKPYVDGGLSSNLPVEPFLDRFAPIVGVHVNPLPEYDPAKRSFIRSLERTLHFAIRGVVHRNMMHCQWFIEPPGLSQFGLFDTHKFDEIYQIGLGYARAYIAEHKLVLTS